APKVAGNGGQRGGDDGGVQRRHEHDEHEPREDEGELAAVKLVRSVIDGQPSLHPSPVFAWWLRTRADEQASWASVVLRVERHRYLAGVNPGATTACPRDVAPRRIA